MALPTQRPTTPHLTTLLFSTLAVLTPQARASQPAIHSPSAEPDLICHTTNPAECYPRIFVPTTLYRKIHHDQQLPPGVNVRIDMTTGDREARWDVPAEAEHEQNSILVVDPPPAPADEDDDPVVLPGGAPVYEASGLVKEPREKIPGFGVAMAQLKESFENQGLKNPENGEGGGTESKAAALDEALGVLEDLSHDIYYGTQIVADPDALKALFCLLTARDASQLLARPLAERRDFLASSILASALQNNPKALRQLEDGWDPLMAHTCTKSRGTLRDSFFSDVRPTDSAQGSGAEEAAWIRTLLPVVGRLLKSDAIRPQFLRQGGMRDLLRILLAQGEEWDVPRARTARIVMDTFLDADVGANVHVWPVGSTEGGDCAGNEGDEKRYDDSCWEFHVEEIARREPDKAGWSGELLGFLRRRRGVDGGDGDGDGDGDGKPEKGHESDARVEL